MQQNLMDGYSITSRRLESGEYQGIWHPMWVNSHEYLIPGDNRRFAAFEEAMNHARTHGREWMRQESAHEAILSSIQNALSQAPRS